MDPDRFRERRLWVFLATLNSSPGRIRAGTPVKDTCPQWRVSVAVSIRNSIPEEACVPGESPHHRLIAFALYGLLTREEPIRRYSCHRLDEAELTEVGTREGLFTSLLRAAFVHSMASRDAA